jgi:RNA polymerase sigma factor (sigma-70 family)
VIQITWLRLAENITRIRTPDALPGWLSTVASREAVRIIKNRLKCITVDDVDITQPDPGANPEDLVIAAQDHAALRAAIATLPLDKQELLAELFAADGRSYAQIAERLGIPVGSLGPNRGRSLARLRQILRPCA